MCASTCVNLNFWLNGVKSGSVFRMYEKARA